MGLPGDMMQGSQRRFSPLWLRGEIISESFMWTQSSKHSCHRLVQMWRFGSLLLTLPYLVFYWFSARKTFHSCDGQFMDPPSWTQTPLGVTSLVASILGLLMSSLGPRVEGPYWVLLLQVIWFSTQIHRSLGLCLHFPLGMTASMQSIWPWVDTAYLFAGSGPGKEGASLWSPVPR